ncbi:hypothetical protein ACFWF4_31765, partial [Nocardiopsis flavescens]
MSATTPPNRRGSEPAGTAPGTGARTEPSGPAPSTGSPTPAVCGGAQDPVTASGPDTAAGPAGAGT